MREKQMGPKTKILVRNDRQLELDILELLQKAQRPISETEVVEALWNKGYLAYDPEERKERN